MLIFNLRYIEKRYALALSSFVVFPLIAAVIVIVIPGCELAYTATALACAVIYLSIQHEEISESRVRAQIMDNLSRMDSLTGLKNRRGYDEALSKASSCTGLGVIFCDLNALKYTNDNFGHAAGDAYIKKFADILRNVFEEAGDICRISGDEFVVILYDIATEKLDEFKERLNSVIKENDRIASVGYAYGENESAIELVGRAEREMYDDKNRYYSETGIDRRRR
jgi:diguanylate cyclase (GGDEF)-like protein